MSSPAQPCNYGLNAAAFSTGSTQTNSYATSIAQNLPTAIRCAPVSVTVATGTQVAVPASVFSAGSGIYTLFCDSGGNNDLSATGSVTIVGGVITDSKGFFCNSLNSNAVYTAGPPVAVASPYQILFLGGAVGSYVPQLYQNVSASLIYSVSAIKIAN
jgi:hypothetical protein